MNTRTMNLLFSSKLTELTECNSSFDSGVLRVCYTGKNRNGSYISKKTFELCMPSIYNCPIVCRYDRETDSIGAHDMELVKGGDGSLRLINSTHPVGVVPSGANYWWEEMEDDSGNMHEYLCVEVLIWKRQEAYRKLKTDGITDESMEISVKEGKMVDGVYVIERFEFTAFCLLGSAEPCYESASLELFSCDDFREQYVLMLQEMKESFSSIQPPETEPGVVINKNEYSMEGGEGVLEQDTVVIVDGVDADALGLDIETAAIEEVNTDEIVDHINEVSEGAEPVEELAHDEVGVDFALAEQFLNELMQAVSAERINTEFGEMARYFYMDHDTELKQVYCYDTEDWNIYGFNYVLNGDYVEVDFESKKRKKIAIVDFDEGEQRSVFAEVYSNIANVYSSNDAQWSAKYQAASDKITSMQSELDTLRQFKADTEKEADDAKRLEIFAQFEDLIGIEAFENLRNDNEQFTIEELEDKCFAIRGRKNSVTKFSVEKSPKLKVPQSEPVSVEPYGGAFVEYGIVPDAQ